MDKKYHKPAAIVFFLLSVVFAVHDLNLLEDTVTRDPRSHCRSDGVVAGRSIALIDMSSEPTERQKNDIRKRLKEFVDDSVMDTKFTFVALGEREPSRTIIPAEEDTFCRPPKNKQEAALGDGTDVYYSTKYENWRRSALPERIAKVINTPETFDQSPILEYIRDISEFRDFRDNGGKRSLLIISDFFQVSKPYINMYRKVPKFEQFRDSPYYQEILTNLGGVQVSAYYVTPSKKSKGRQARQGFTRHKKFWLSYLNSTGAEVKNGTIRDL